MVRRPRPGWPDLGRDPRPGRVQLGRLEAKLEDSGADRGREEVRATRSPSSSRRATSPGQSRRSGEVIPTRSVLRKASRTSTKTTPPLYPACYDTLLPEHRGGPTSRAIARNQEIITRLLIEREQIDRSLTYHHAEQDWLHRCKEYIAGSTQPQPTGGDPFASA